MTGRLPHILFGVALGLAACSTVSTPDADIRDIRPTQIERDDKVIVEAFKPIFTVGAPTTVTLNVETVGHGQLQVVARAVSVTRVLFDADKGVQDQVGRHVQQETSVTVEQLVDGKPRRFTSMPSAPFTIDLFPHSLHSLAEQVNDRVGKGDLWSWLGMSVAPAPAGAAGVLVADVQRQVDREALFRTYDLPPIDGKLSKHEARVGEAGGLSVAEFDRLDTDGDGVIHTYEVDDLKSGEGLAARAGLNQGDLIVAANGKPVTSIASLERAWTGNDDMVKLAVKRGATDASVALPRFGRPASIPSWLIFAICMGLAAGLIALPVPVIGGLIVVWERKISAYMQSRIGPNRVGPGGWLQWLADGLKLIMKEDLIPALERLHTWTPTQKVLINSFLKKRWRKNRISTIRTSTSRRNQIRSQCFALRQARKNLNPISGTPVSEIIVANCGKCQRKLDHPNEVCPFCGFKNRGPFSWEWMYFIFDAISWIMSIGGCFFPFAFTICLIVAGIAFL